MQTLAREKFISYARQSIDQTDIDAVSAVLKSDYLTTGPAVIAFEQALAAIVQEKFAVCVNSGTAALQVAMAALGIGPGDWVIVPAITFLATANAARLCGAEVIFTDVDPENGLMNPQHLLQAIEKNRDKNIKAVVSVHLTGQTENLSEISRIAREHHLWFIEDASHALGTEYIQNQHYFIGNCQQSDVVTFSFHAVKTIAMGEGGAITTHHADLYQRALQLRSHGMTRDQQTFLYHDRAFDSLGAVNPWYYEMVQLGLNYRASDIHCALGLSQLKKLPYFTAKRRQLVSLYDELLKPLDSWIKPIKKTSYCRPVLHLYSVLIDFTQLPLSRAALMRALHERGIGTQVHYIPVHQQPYYEKRYGSMQLMGVNDYYAKTLSLPLYSAMTEDDVIRVVDCLADLMRHA